MCSSDNAALQACRECSYSEWDSSQGVASERLLSPLLELGRRQAGGSVAQPRSLARRVEDSMRHLELATARTQQSQQTLEDARYVEKMASGRLVSGHEWAARIQEAIPELVREIYRRKNELFEQDRIVTEMRSALKDNRRRLEKARTMCWNSSQVLNGHEADFH